MTYPSIPSILDKIIRGKYGILMVKNRGIRDLMDHLWVYISLKQTSKLMVHLKKKFLKRPIFQRK